MSTDLTYTRDSGHLRSGWILGLLLIVGAYAGEPDRQANEPRAIGFDSFDALAKSAEGLEWEAEGDRWLRAVDKVWERNGWDSEAHQYARKMMHDVTAVPPWDFFGRFNAMSECIRERYDLSPDQTAQFQGALLREMGGMLMQHGGLIIDHSVEMLQTRAANKPFTSEQVARWTVEGEGLSRDSRTSADRIKAELEPLLRAEQKKVWAQDWAAFDQRWKVVDDMRSEWAKGKWDPAQWGLENDPIQRGLKVGGDERAAVSELPVDQDRTRRGATSPTKWLAHDPSTWIAYVRDMKQRYALDPGQMNAAWSIHSELVERATAYAETHADRLRVVPVSDRSTHERYEPIRSIFGELRERLEAMLTDRQRDQVER